MALIFECDKCKESFKLEKGSIKKYEVTIYYGERVDGKRSSIRPDLCEKCCEETIKFMGQNLPE